MTVAEEYVAARTVLLDALKALERHRSSVILIGAQAVYVWSGEGNFTVAVMTTDADLALDADHLEPDPEVAATLRDHGFHLKERGNPGQWVGRGDIALDLMVSEHHAGRGRRSASLPPHEGNVARRGRGLAPALVDHEIKTISALSEEDPRSVEVAVAGPAALIVAKCIKLKERLEAKKAGERDRTKPKDALDIHRILTAVEPDTLVEGFLRHRTQEDAHQESQEAVAFLEAESEKPDSWLPAMVARAAEDDTGEVAQNFVWLVEELVEELHQ